MPRSSIGVMAGAVALAAVLASAPVAAAGNAPARTAGPSANSSEVAKQNAARVMPPPHQAGWVDRVIGKFKPKPPKTRCRG